MLRFLRTILGILFLATLVVVTVWYLVWIRLEQRAQFCDKHHKAYKKRIPFEGPDDIVKYKCTKCLRTWLEFKEF